MAVATTVVAYLRDCGFDASQQGVEIVVNTSAGTVKLPVDDPSLTPDPAKPDWIAFLYWHASRYEHAPTTVAVVEKPWNYADQYGEFKVEAKLEELAAR